MIFFEYMGETIVYGDYEWDSKKNETNKFKHRVSFEEAVIIFESRILKTIDTRKNYGETRHACLGNIENIVFLSVISTPRNGRTRIISARRASQQERKIYNENI